MLHDMNHGTIDMDMSPKAQTDFTMVPIDSWSSSDYFFPLWDRRSGRTNPELIVVDNFGKYVASRVKKGSSGEWKNGYDGGKGKRFLIFHHGVRHMQIFIIKLTHYKDYQYIGYFNQMENCLR